MPRKKILKKKKVSAKKDSRKLTIDTEALVSAFSLFLDDLAMSFNRINSTIDEKRIDPEEQQDQREHR
jgi:hypothetical protein